MTEEYTPPYTSTPLATGSEAAPPVGSQPVPPVGTPPVVGYPTPPTGGAGSAGNTNGSDGSTTEVAKEQAGQVAQGAVEAGQHVAEVAKEQAVNVGAEAGRQARDLFSQASSEVSQQASQQQQRLAQSIRSLGDELHKMTQSGEQASGPAADLARQGAQRTRDLASWLEQREPGDVLAEVTNFARRRPGAFLLLAAGAGLLAGRLTRGLQAASSDQGQGIQGDPSQWGSHSSLAGDPSQWGAQYGSGVQYGETTQYAGAQYGESDGPVVLGTVEEIEVVRPYASSEDGPVGYPTSEGPIPGGTR